MPAKFELKQSSNGMHFFNLLASNGEIILTSQMYSAKSSAKKGIAAVQANAGTEARYGRKQTRTGKAQFVLKSTNHRVIGTSESYNSKSAMQNGIKSVMKNGKTKTVVEV